MAKSFFVWLGSGRTRKHAVGPSARLLDKAARAPLPVPPGAILLDEFRLLAYQEQLAINENGRTIITDPSGLHDMLFSRVRLPRFDRPVVVRRVLPERASPLASSQNYSIRQPANPQDALQLAQALAAAWSPGPAQGQRYDTLIMEMIPTQFSGTVNLDQRATVDEVCYYIGPPDERASAPNHLTLARLPQVWSSPSAELPPFAQRLQKLLGGIRRTFNGQNLVLEWIDDAEVSWVWHLAPPEQIQVFS